LSLPVLHLSGFSGTRFTFFQPAFDELWLEAAPTPVEPQSFIVWVVLLSGLPEEFTDLGLVPSRDASGCFSR